MQMLLYSSTNPAEEDLQARVQQSSGAEASAPLRVAPRLCILRFAT